MVIIKNVKCFMSTIKKITPKGKAVEDEKKFKTENLSIEDGSKFDLQMVTGYILVEPYLANPFRRTVTESGLIPTEIPMEKNPDTGEMQFQNLRIKVGVVKRVGPECKQVQTGDIVYFDNMMTTPIHFMGEEYFRTHESQVLAVAKLTE